MNILSRATSLRARPLMIHGVGENIGREFFFPVEAFLKKFFPREGLLKNFEIYFFFPGRPLEFFFS